MQGSFNILQPRDNFLKDQLCFTGRACKSNTSAEVISDHKLTSKGFTGCGFLDSHFGDYWSGQGPNNDLEEPFGNLKIKQAYLLLQVLAYSYS
jgi:hypothetical protein